MYYYSKAAPPAARAMKLEHHADTGPQFTGTSRFEVLDRLGKGGMGVVYRVLDRERGTEVALKTLRRIDAASLFRFKKEFRALTDIVHDNLVSLYELVYDSDQWFFTMELVHGVDFLTWIHGHENLPPAPARPPSIDTGTDETQVTRPVDTITERTPPPLPPILYGRLRAALRQLAGGVAALHASGYLHRDIKPSNVLVTPSGRVVLLDFGVITEVAGTRWHGAGSVDAVGTPAFMAPEQVTDRGAGEASDWYGLGVLLYLALTGRRPFEGRSEDVLRAKQNTVPAPPRVVRPDVARDLDQLCVDLLDPDPDKRPRAAEILARLGAETPSPGAALGVGDRDPVELIGRGRQLDALTRAFERAQRGDGSITLVHGVSGMGKSTVVERFLDDIVDRTGAVVLSGRCYERESVPYKAVDSLIDSLCHFLLGLPSNEVEALMPRDAQTLATVFPVLRRVESVAQAPGRAHTAPDPREVRRRAFVALRELLARLADRRPLILCVDDLQWGDVDSAVLIDTLMRRPEPPALLFLGAYRTDEVDHSPLLRALLQPERDPGAPELELVELSLLDRDEAAGLAEALLGDGASPAIVATVARESGGNPFFAHELARFYRDRLSAEVVDTTAVTLEQVINARVAALSPAAQTFVAVAAVAGQPTAQQVIQRAAELDEATRASVLTAVRAANLIRSSGVRDLDRVEPYHDRVRETVVASLSPYELRQIHHALAVAIQALPHPDAETLAAHFHAAGDRAAATEYALRAAATAEAALSFERAAELYGMALTESELDPDRRRELLSLRAAALVNAGRGPEAAAAFVAAAELTGGLEATRLRRLAAEHWLRSGHVDEGRAALESVVDDLGMSLPGSSVGAIASLLYQRGKLRLRGLRFRPRDPGEARGIDLARIDTCWSIATGLSLIDSIKSAVFGPRGVALSLAAGDPYRVARALALEAGFLAALGNRTRRRADLLITRADRAASRSSNPHGAAFVRGMRAFIAYERGGFGDAHELCESTLEQLRDTCAGTYWESGALQLFSIHSLLIVGEMRAARRLVSERLADAEARGDLATAVSLRLIILSTLHLAVDDVDAARDEVDNALARWRDAVSDDFSQQHYMALGMRVQNHLYAGHGRDALALIDEHRQALRRSLLLNVHIIRANLLMQEAQAALHAAGDGGDDHAALLARVERLAGKLDREGLAWTSAHAALLRAGAAARKGDGERTIALTRAAVDALDAAKLRAHAYCARWYLGAMVGGDEGAELQSLADDWRQRESLANWSGVLRGFAPGFD